MGASFTRQGLAALGTLPESALPVEQALQRVMQATDALFGVAATGLLLSDGDQLLRTVAVSDPRVAALGQAHADTGQGPCLDAFWSSDTVYTGDLADEPRWPAFTPVARAMGLRAVLATAVPHGNGSVGVLAMLSDRRHPWSDAERQTIAAFADLVTML